MNAEQLELPLNTEAPDHPARAELRRGWRRVVGDGNRVQFLEALYTQDGRHHRDHPQHGRYTGLAQAFFQSLGESVARIELDSPECEIGDLLDAPSALQMVASLAARG